jgi:flagellar motor switch protein FliN
MKTNKNEALKDIELQPMENETVSDQLAVDKSFELIKDIEIQLSLRVGEATTTVDELYNYKVGSLVKLDRQTNDYVDVLYQGKVVAQGELVAIDDNFGVKIQEVFVEK